MGLKKRILSGLLIILLCSTSFFAITHQNGAIYGLTNAKGEDNCTHCHSYFPLITSGNYHDSISLTSRFTANGYLADSLYVVTISIGFKGIIKAGFQACFLDTNNNNAGVIVPAVGVQKLFDANYARLYATHSADHNTGNGNTPMVWQFKWQAPPKNIGVVKVYCTFVVANNDATYSGDSVFAKVFTISPSTEIPKASIYANHTTICAGQSINLTDSGTSNAQKWNWIINGPTNQSFSSKSIAFAPKSPGIYTVRLKNQNIKAWSNFDTITFTVKPNPKAELNIKGNIQKCTEDPVLLELKGKNYTAINWSDGIKNISSRNIIDTGSYYVSIDSAGCRSNSATIKIHNFQRHPLSLKHNQAFDSICRGTLLTLQASAPISLISTTFYSPIGKMQTNSNQKLNLIFNNDTVIYAQSIDVNQCKTEVSAPINLMVAPKPNASFTYLNTGLTYTFQPKDTANQTYKWYFGEFSAYSFDKFPVYRYSNSVKPIKVTLEITNKFDCIGKDSTVLNLPLFTNKLSPSGLKIYPNPADESCKILIENQYTEGTISIYDPVGEAVYKTAINESITEIPTAYLNEGLYFFSIKLPSGTFNIPVTVKHKN